MEEKPSNTKTVRARLSGGLLVAFTDKLKQQNMKEGEAIREAIRIYTKYDPFNIYKKKE